MNPDTCYIVCHGCKKGQIEDPSRPNINFSEKHGAHNIPGENYSTLELVPEAVFLSHFLKKGFKDIDRPDLVAVQLENDPKSLGSIGKVAPFGNPEPKKRPRIVQQPSFGKRTMDGIASLAAEEQKKFNEACKVGKEQLERGEIVEVPRSLIKRPDWDHYFMAVADVIKIRGTCSRLQVGSVIVDSRQRIVSTGYNGAPRGMEHCHHDMSVAMIGVDPYLKDGHCINAEHAERNAILMGENTRMLNGTLYVTAAPCLTCCRMAVTVGIERIVYHSEYKLTRAVPELCKRASIVLMKLDFLED